MAPRPVSRSVLDPDVRARDASAPSASEAVRGIAAMVLATQLLPLGDMFSKLLTGVLPPLEVALWRSAAQAAILSALWLALPGRRRGTMVAPVVAASGLCFLATLICLISAFAVMPIATAIGIFFVEPLLLTLLSALLLGERIGPRRLVAVALGLAGALIVIRPADPVHGWATFLPLGAALFFALNAILVRRALATRSALTVQTGSALTATAAMTLAMAAVWLGDLGGLAAPRIGGAPPWALPLIVAAGATAAGAFLLIGTAFARVEAARLAPLQYLEIVGAVALGALVFGDLPDAPTVAGIALILASGLFVMRRERRVRTTRPPA